MDYKIISFDLFRYQLLPNTQDVQIDLLRNVRTIEDLKANKNIIFKETITSLENFYHSGYEIHHKIVMDKGDWFVFKIGSKKTVERESHEFVTEKIESWPSVTVIINNNPEIQTIAVSTNSKAFSASNVVSNIIEKTLQKHLNNQQLNLHIRPMSENTEFWHCVDKFEGRITMIRFELISPNMSNISKSLKVDLQQINKDTNSHLMNLELNASKGTFLEVKKDNEMIDGIVDYSSEGGGDITLKVKGYKKSIHTQKTIRTVELDEFQAENINSEMLDTILELFKPK